MLCSKFDIFHPLALQYRAICSMMYILTFLSAVPLKEFYRKRQVQYNVWFCLFWWEMTIVKNQCCIGWMNRHVIKAITKLLCSLITGFLTNVYILAVLCVHPYKPKSGIIMIKNLVISLLVCYCNRDSRSKDKIYVTNLCLK